MLEAVQEINKCRSYNL